jgi:hypothetical protein
MTSQPSPPVLPPPAHRPHAGIADAVSGLRDLDELPLAQHAARFNAVHDSLSAALSSIDEV